MLIEENDLLIGENIYDVTEWLRTTPRTWRYKESEDPYSRAMDWDLNAGWQASLDMSETGWYAGVHKIHTLMAALPPQERKKLYTHWDTSGDYGDLNRALRGDPLPMASRRKRRAASLVTTIVVNMSANCSVPAQDFVNLGVAFASVINTLENEGRRVELLVVHSSQCGNKNITHGWWVKKANHPLDLDQLAFAIAHPASFRRIGFAMRERSDPSVQCGHYGYTTNLPKQMVERMCLPDDTIILNAADLWHTHTKTPEAAVAAVSKLVNPEQA